MIRSTKVVRAVVAVGLVTALVTATAGLGSAPAGARSSRLALAWSAVTRGEPSFLLADRDGAVVISEDGRVTSFATNGSQRWSTDVGDGEAVVFQDLPSLGAGIVIVPVDQQEAVALERRTGDERWRVPFANVHSTGAGTDAAGAALAAVVDRSGTLAVLDGATGRTRWSVQLPDFQDDFTHVWFAGDRVLAQWTPLEPGSRLAAFDAANGGVVWSRDMLGASRPSVLDGHVLFAEMLEPWSEGRANRARAQSLDVESGAPRWETEIQTRTVYFTAAASAAQGDSFAIVDLAGRVRVFDARDGTERWARATRREQYEADLRIAGDVVTMSTYGTGLVALSSSTGRPVGTEPIGRTQLGMTIEATAAAGDRLYLLVSESGPVRGGGEVWSFRATR